MGQGVGQLADLPRLMAAQHKVAEILQPDIEWCGGLTTCRKIAEAAGLAGMQVILHAGGLTAPGIHFSYTTPSVPWCEYFVASPPGVPLEEGNDLPGLPLPKDGWLTPTDSPGFGLEIPQEWFTPF
jgi:L-rhamnonate dehydratase